MNFNPEDGVNVGPHCRNCHKGASDCAICHSGTGPQQIPVQGATQWPRAAFTTDTALAIDSRPLVADYGNPVWAGTSAPNGALGNPDIGDGWASYLYFTDPTLQSPKGNPFPTGTAGTTVQTSSMYKSLFGTEQYVPMLKWERSVTWAADWRTNPGTLSATCSNDGFSWPHRTLGWKMLKDDLFGVDFTGNPIGVGMTRTYTGDYDTGTGALDTAQSKLDDYVDANLGHLKAPAHDLDSVCLDCHNPTIWNATSGSHADAVNNANDNYNDELLLRGLP